MSHISLLIIEKEKKWSRLSSHVRENVKVLSKLSKQINVICHYTIIFTVTLTLDPIATSVLTHGFLRSANTHLVLEDCYKQSLVKYHMCVPFYFFFLFISHGSMLITSYMFQLLLQVLLMRCSTLVGLSSYCLIERFSLERQAFQINHVNFSGSFLVTKKRGGSLLLSHDNP